MRRRVTACFVALDVEERIAGFYTLASTSVFLADLPAEILKKLPRYPSFPAVRMGRLAVDEAYKGQGLGGAMLADALLRPARAQIAACALIVDAKDEPAAAFYRHHGFVALPLSALTLFLPLASCLSTHQLKTANLISFVSATQHLPNQLERSGPQFLSTESGEINEI